MSSPAKLNLGCGAFRKEGFVNVDIDPALKPDVCHNLDQIPYPFPDASFDHIESDHVFEHLQSPLSAMGEVYRILKPGGTITLRVPHHSRGFTHPDHKRGFDLSFPYYFRADFRGGYTGYPFLLQSQKLVWFAQPYLKKSVLPPAYFFIGMRVGSVIDFVASLWPELCSRVWCFWVGGFEELEFSLKKLPRT